MFKSVSPARNPDAVTWLVGMGMAGLGLLGAAAWLYEKTRKKIQHPSLGTLTFRSGSWTGLLSHYQAEQPAIRFELPGDKSGPSAAELDRFLDFWKNIESTVDTIREQAILKFEEIADAYEESEEAELVSEIQEKLDSDPKSFDQYWVLVEIYREVSKIAPTVGWVLEFEVSWDVEHNRSAYLSVDGQLLNYDLSCAGSGLEEF